MQVIILDSPQHLGPYTANLILDAHSGGELNVLGVATGASPQPVYQSLANAPRKPLRHLQAVFALDEYVGLPREHPQSYHQVIHRDVTIPLGLDPSRVHVPNGNAPDLAAAAAEYENMIQYAGGVDIQILGIGSTGHIGFNEPTSSLMSRTRQKTLTEKTRADNARFFDQLDEVPTTCLTQGLGTILDARRVILIAQGTSKAKAIAAAVEGPLTSMCPGSVLQLHPDATIVLDNDAASLLTLAPYYGHAAANSTP